MAVLALTLDSSSLTFWTNSTARSQMFNPVVNKRLRIALDPLIDSSVVDPASAYVVG